jgi:hypothetical protein
VTHGRRLHAAPLDDLPDGAIVLVGGAPFLVLGERLLAWAPEGYATARPRPAGEQAELITPPSLVAVLDAGWHGVVPLLHPSALKD